jgi:hypothetical protein
MPDGVPRNEARRFFVSDSRRIAEKCGSKKENRPACDRRAMHEQLALGVELNAPR